MVSVNTRCELNGSVSIIKVNNWLTFQNLSATSSLELFYVGLGRVFWLVGSFVLCCGDMLTVWPP